MTEPLTWAGAFALTGVLVWLAPRLGLLDRPESAPERKLQRGPVPRVGGIVLALGLGVLWFAGDWTPVAPLAFGLAFALGLADDLAPRGLPRALKFGMEAGVCALFAWETPGSFAFGFGLAALALAAANTFDNADGALAMLSASVLAVVATAISALVVGFLPWNTILRRDASRPLAYLGDSGSHLLGVLLVADLRSAPVLLLPLLDVLRLSWVRWRAGSRPWIGDRRHLAHRLQALGLEPFGVAIILMVMAVPSWFMPLAWGAGTTTCLYCVALALTPDPCPRPGSAG